MMTCSFTSYSSGTPQYQKQWQKEVSGKQISGPPTNDPGFLKGAKTVCGFHIIILS
jgi:hypothetical protein